MFDIIVCIECLCHFVVTVGTVESSELFGLLAVFITGSDIFKLPFTVSVQEEWWFGIRIGVCITSDITSAA